MSYPEGIGPNPEMSGREHFALFRRKLAAWIFGHVEHKPGPVEERDFSLAIIEYGEYFDVHHEKYLTKRYFPERRFLPVGTGDVTIVAIQDYENYQSDFTYYVAAAYPPQDDRDPLEIDYALVFKKYSEEEDAEVFYDVPILREDVQRLFLDKIMLQPGSECYVLHRKKTDDVLRELKPNDIVGPIVEDELSIIGRQIQLQKILRAIGYSSSAG